MITIQITPDDLTKMRFAYRPLLEVCFSFRVLVAPEFQSPYLRWVNEALRTLHEADFPFMTALIPGHGYIPDFLTPTPTTRQVDLEGDLQELLMTPDELVRVGILELIEEHGDSEIRRFVLAHPREALQCLVDELRLYWQLTLKPYWSRMIATLEGDVLHKARRLALEGPAPMFPDLHPSISFQDNQLRIKPICNHRSDQADLILNGAGLQLVPLVFRGCGRAYQVTPAWRPMLAYGIRGGGLWYQPESYHNQSLELALGSGRARVLQLLVTPSSTREVAHKAQITASAASQHLMRLTKAGLVEPHRSGKWVYYRLTERGENLLALFDTMG